MYDPSIGRFTSVDPTGFAAGDANLYRLEGNNPTNEVDPTGLAGIPISDEFKAKLDIQGGGVNPEEYLELIAAFEDAAMRVLVADYVLRYRWDEVTEKFRYFSGPGIVNKVENPRWTQINRDRQLYLDRLAAVRKELECSDTKIIVNRTWETHPERNPMYTSSGLRRSWSKIYLRVYFWEIGRIMRASWTSHEYGRYFLNLNDDADTKDGHSVWEWDAVLDSLNSWYPLLPEKPIKPIDPNAFINGNYFGKSPLDLITTDKPAVCDPIP
jgi:hypothetical protein